MSQRKIKRKKRIADTVERLDPGENDALALIREHEATAQRLLDTATFTPCIITIAKDTKETLVGQFNREAAIEWGRKCLPHALVARIDQLGDGLVLSTCLGSSGRIHYASALMFRTVKGDA